MGGGEKGKSKIAPGRKSDQSRMGTFYGRTISFNSQINYMNIKGRSDCSKLRDLGNVAIKWPMCGPVYFLFQISHSADGVAVESPLRWKRANQYKHRGHL